MNASMRWHWPPPLVWPQLDNIQITCYILPQITPLPQFVPEESYWQTAWKDEDSGPLFTNVGGNRKLIWTLKRILIFPITHTFHTQRSSVPQGPSMMTCIYFLILLIFLYHLAQTEKNKQAFPHASGQILLPMSLVRLLHKWNYRLIPKIRINLWLTFTWQILKCH